jgi:hypothetical protein
MYARFSVLLGLILFSGVATAGLFKSAEERLKEDAAKFADKALLAGFYPQDESLQPYRLQISSQTLLLSQGEYAGYKSNEEVVQKYRQTDYTQDAVATRFKRYAQASGLTISTYKSRINEAVSAQNTPASLFGRHGHYADQDSCLIATNASGRMVAILYRFLRIEPNFATKGFTQYSIILSGDAVRRVEDKVPSSLLTDFKYPYN